MRTDDRGSRFGLVGVALVVAAALLVGLGCAGVPSKPVDEATVILHLTSRVGAVEGKTALISFTVAPEAPATLTAPATATFGLTSPAGTVSVQPQRALGGLQVQEPMILGSLGRCTLTLNLGTNGQLVVDDRWGHVLRFSQLSVAFDNVAVGETTLPATARIVTPLEGGPLSLGDVWIEGLEPEQPVSYSATLSGGLRLSGEGAASVDGVVWFREWPTGRVSSVSSAQITFGEALGATRGG